MMPRVSSDKGARAAPAHRLDDRTRTDDIRVSEDVNFEGLLLTDNVLQGLTEAGFQRPSPIQLRAIPIGRCGVDLIVQAKSGTGKTCVLAVLALEQLAAAPPTSKCQTLVLAPTREVAVQVAQVVQAVGAHVPGLAVHSLIGGLPLAQDVANLRRCNVAVGTPGRVRQLVDSGALNTESVRLFVLDEADKLMEDAFVEDLNFIYSTLPSSKQMIALSATYPDRLAELLARYMRSPTFVRLGRSSAALLGIRQYAVRVPHHPLVQNQMQLKLETLLKLLTNVQFTQCLIFSNHQSRAETLCNNLERLGWPSTHLSSALTQERRLQALERLTSLRCRVLVSTDLAARGVDSPHVDLVVHLDVPWDGATYLHRVGRAGRYGSLGAAVSLVAAGEEEGRLRTVVEAAGVTLLKLQDPGVERDLKTCDVEGWEVFDVEVEEEEKGIFDVDGDELEKMNGKEISKKSDKYYDQKTSSKIKSGNDEEISNYPNGKMNGSQTSDGEPDSASAVKISASGRKIRVAKRRTAVKETEEFQQEIERINTEKAWLESEKQRMETAVDGWAQAVKTRTNVKPGPSKRSSSTNSSKVPSVRGGVSSGLSQNGVGLDKVNGDQHVEDESAESDDSFTKMLEEYRRHQVKEQETTEEGDRSSSNGITKKGTASNSTAGPMSEELVDKAVIQSKVGVTAAAKKEVKSNDKDRLNAQKSKGHFKTVQNGKLSSEARSERQKPAGTQATDGSAKSDGGTGYLSKGSKSQPEDVCFDKTVLHKALAKLNPRQASTLTEDELSVLASYVEHCRTNRLKDVHRAFEVFKDTKVNDILIRFGHREIALNEVLGLVNEKSSTLEEDEIVDSFLEDDVCDESSSSHQSCEESSQTQIPVSKPAVKAGDFYPKAIISNSTPADRSAISTADRGATYIGEEIHSMAYVPEEAALFQKRIRLQVEKERIRRAAERARKREKTRERRQSSCGDESDEVDEQDSDNQQPERELQDDINNASNVTSSTRGPGCRPKDHREAAHQVPLFKQKHRLVEPSSSSTSTVGNPRLVGTESSTCEPPRARKVFFDLDPSMAGFVQERDHQFTKPMRQEASIGQTYSQESQSQRSHRTGSQAQHAQGYQTVQGSRHFDVPHNQDWHPMMQGYDGSQAYPNWQWNPFGQGYTGVRSYQHSQAYPNTDSYRTAQDYWHSQGTPGNFGRHFSRTPPHGAHANAEYSYLQPGWAHPPDGPEYLRASWYAAAPPGVESVQNPGGEAWRARLSQCYREQTAYITSMTRFYRDYYYQCQRQVSGARQ